VTATRRDILVCLALAAVMALLPFLVGTRYIITQMTLFFIWAVVVTQWNLVLGVAGIFSLAQMALFAVGAYATAMLGYYFAVPMVLAMPVAALAAVAVSLAIGLACLRLRGPSTSSWSTTPPASPIRRPAACRCSAACAASRASATSASAPFSARNGTLPITMSGSSC
jgi:hypothetical protein